jgi:hypothetical protein
MDTKNDNELIQSTVHLPRGDHKKFKAIVVAKGEKQCDVYAALIRQYIQEHKSILVSLDMA